METSTAELLEKLQESVRKGDVLSSAVLIESAASGKDIPASHLTKIGKWTRTEQAAETLHTFPVLMIDTDPTRNNVIYTSESQKKSIKSWQGTTFLFNHTAQNGGGLWGGSADHTLQAASQMGRIYESKLVKTPKGAIGSLAHFYSVEGIDATTDGFIRKLEAGILREVSIHVSVPEGVICSICNDAFSKCMDNSGEYHYPGETYKKPKGNGKETCYMSTGTSLLTPLELSAVACPGSVNAHVMQDDEVEDYPVTSLREALGGSREVIHLIHQENTMTDVQLAAARTKLAEAAKAAGVKIRDFIATEANKDLVESAQVTAETVDALFPEVAPTEVPVVEPPAVVTPPKAQSHLFADADCPVCGRGQEIAPVVAEPEATAALRTEFETKILSVIEKSDAAIAAANARVDAAETSNAAAQEMFNDIVAETVTLAIESGTKKEPDRNAYQEQLAALPYPAVREIRETLRASKTTTVTRKEKLVETMSERAKNLLGSTEVVKTDKGTSRSATGDRARFAASK